MFQIKYQDKKCKIPISSTETDPILEQIGSIFGVNNQDFILYYKNVYLSRLVNYKLLEIGYDPYEILEVKNFARKMSYYNISGYDYIINHQESQFTNVFTTKQYFSQNFCTVPQNIIIKYKNTVLTDSENMIKYETSKSQPFQIFVKDNYLLVPTYLSKCRYICLELDSTVKNLKETISVYSQEGNSIISSCTYSPKMKEICKQNDLNCDADIDNKKLHELKTVVPLFEFVQSNPENNPGQIYKITVEIKDDKFDKSLTKEYQASCSITLYTITVLLEKDLRIDRSLFVPFNKKGDKIDLTETVSKGQKTVLFKIFESLYVKVGESIQKVSYLTTIRDLRDMNNFQNHHFGTVVNNHFAYYRPNDKYLLIHFMNNEKDPNQTTLINYQKSKVPCKFMTYIKVEENRRVKIHFIIPKKMKDTEIAQNYLHQSSSSITYLDRNDDEITYKVSDKQTIKYKLIDLKGQQHIQEIEIRGRNLRVIDLLLSIYNQENTSSSAFINHVFGKLMKKYDAALPKFENKELKFWEPLLNIFSDDNNMITIEGYKGLEEMNLLNLVNSSTRFDKIPFEGRLKAHEIISNYCKKNKMSELHLRLYSDFNMLNPNDIPSLLKPRYSFLILNHGRDKKKLILKNSTKFQCELVIESKNFDKCADIIKGMFNLPEGELTFSGTLNDKYYFLEQSFDAGCFPDNFTISLRYKYKHLDQMTFRYGGTTKVLKIDVDKKIELIIPDIQKEFNLWNYSKKAIRLSFFSFDFPHDQSFSYFKFPETATITILTKLVDAFPLQIAKVGSEEFNDYYFVNGEKIHDLIDHFKKQYNQDIYPYKNNDGTIQMATTKKLEKNMKLYISGELKTVKYIGNSSHNEIEVNSILTVKEASKFLHKSLKRKVYIFTKNKDDNSYDPAIENKLLFELEGKLFAHKFVSTIEFNYKIFSKPQHISEMNTVKWLKEKYIARHLLICVDDFIIKKNAKKVDDEVTIGEALKKFNGLLEIFIETGINRKIPNRRKSISKFKPVTVSTDKNDGISNSTKIVNKKIMPQKSKMKSDDDSDEGSDKHEDFTKKKKVKSSAYKPKTKEINSESSDDEKERSKNEQKRKTKSSFEPKKKQMKESSDDDDDDEKIKSKNEQKRETKSSIESKKKQIKESSDDDEKSDDEKIKYKNEQKTKTDSSSPEQKKKLKIEISDDDETSEDDESSDEDDESVDEEEVTYKIQIGRDPVRTISLKKSATINDAKIKIAKEEDDIDPNCVIILFAGKNLKKNIVIEKLRLTKNDVLQVYIRNIEEVLLRTAKALQVYGEGNIEENYSEYEDD